MYRRPKFLEVLLQIREQMARDADYDVDRFTEMVRTGRHRNGYAALSLTDQPSADTVPAKKRTARNGKVKRKA